jgi:hypothetical protein
MPHSTPAESHSFRSGVHNSQKPPAPRNFLHISIHTMLI